MHRQLALLPILWFVLAGCAETNGVHEVGPSEWARAEPPSAATLGRGLLVTPDESLDRPVKVLAVLDFHTKAKSQDKGFDELRAKAAELGADAVTTAEFEHGDGDEPSHLSGIAVKFIERDERPYTVLGELDVATPEDADDKGFEELRARARALGADQLRSITFEHGAEGGMSHLKGIAVRHEVP
jgi:hypothetical protein